MFLVGWQLFCRPPDFSELDLCDVVVDAEGMTVTIRYPCRYHGIMMQRMTQRV